MSERIYTINRALALPLALNAVLLLIVIGITFIRQGTAIERYLLFAAFLPMAVIAGESWMRSITVSDAGVAIRKFFKVRSFNWTEITHVGVLAVRKKVYLVLTTTKGFYVLSNAYGGFRELAQTISGRVDAERVEEEVKTVLEQPVENRSTIIAAWLSAILLMGVVALKITS